MCLVLVFAFYCCLFQHSNQTNFKWPSYYHVQFYNRNSHNQFRPSTENEFVGETIAHENKKRRRRRRREETPKPKPCKIMCAHSSGNCDLFDFELITCCAVAANDANRTRPENERETTTEICDFLFFGHSMSYKLLIILTKPKLEMTNGTALKNMIQKSQHQTPNFS